MSGSLGQNTYIQYSETNVMHFLFSLLRIQDLYMFRALLAHPKEALHKRHLVYCVRFNPRAATSTTADHIYNRTQQSPTLRLCSAS
jgi:hypothetical protein